MLPNSAQFAKLEKRGYLYVGLYCILKKEKHDQIKFKSAVFRSLCAEVKFNKSRVSVLDIIFP